MCISEVGQLPDSAYTERELSSNPDGARERYFVLSVANRAGPANATNAKSDVMGVTLPSWYRASTYITFLPCEL